MVHGIGKLSEVLSVLTIFDAIFVGKNRHGLYFTSESNLSLLRLHLTKSNRLLRSRLRFLPQLTQGVSTESCR